MEGYPKNSKAVHSTYQAPSVYHLVHSGQRCFVFLGQRCQPCRVAATLAHLPSSPSCCPWAGRAQSSSSGKRRLLLFKTRVSGPVESVFCVFFFVFFPVKQEVGSLSGKVIQNHFLFILQLHLIKNRSTALRKLLKWKKSGGQGRNLGQ